MEKLLGGLGCLVFAYAFRHRVYHYAFIPVLLVVYELAGDPGQYIFFNLTDANVIGFAEKLILILITVSLWIFAKRENESRGRWVPALFSTAACVFRFIRSFAFDWYTGQMTQPGADVLTVYQAFTQCCSIIDFLTQLVILLMLASIFWRMPDIHPRKTEN